jgi:hypothetical protein
MFICIYSLEQHESSTGEHILQNFLGPRWTSNQIVCNRLQEEFGHTIDSALEQGLRHCRIFLGHYDGRRNSRGRAFKTEGVESGAEYLLKPGSIPALRKPHIVHSGTNMANIHIPDASKIGWAYIEFKKKFPNSPVSREQFYENTVGQESQSNEPLTSKQSIGGGPFFRGILKSAFNLLGASNPDIALSSDFNSLREYVINENSDSRSFIRWVGVNNRQDFGIEEKGLFDHILTVYSRNSGVYGYIRLYGEFALSLRLAEEYSDDLFCYSYLVDPLRISNPAEQRNIEVNIGLLPIFEDQPEVADDGGIQSLISMFERFGEKLTGLKPSEEIKHIQCKAMRIMIDSKITPEQKRQRVDALVKETEEKIRKHVAFAEHIMKVRDDK